MMCQDDPRKRTIAYLFDDTICVTVYNFDGNKDHVDLLCSRCFAIGSVPSKVNISSIKANVFQLI